MSNTNFSFPQDEYPEDGDKLLPEGIRGNWDVLISHGSRHHGSGPDSIDASELDGQGKGEGFNADMVDGNHIGDIMAEAKNVVRELITSGTGQTEQKTVKENINQDAMVIKKEKDVDREFQINQGANDHTDPINDNFDDEANGPNTTFVAKEMWVAQWEYQLPNFFLNLNTLSVRKERPDFDPADRYQGLFFPASTSTDQNNFPIEQPSIIQTDLERQKLVFEMRLPRKIGYEDNNGNFVSVETEFIDHPNIFNWTIELEGEVAVIQGHAEKHGRNGVDPLDATTLAGQGSGKGFNADRVDNKDASELERVIPTQPPLLSWRNYSQRSSDFLMMVWYKPAIDGLIVAIAHATRSIVDGTISLTVEPVGSTEVNHVEPLRTRAAGLGLSADPSGTYDANATPHVAVDSVRTAALFQFDNNLTFGSTMDMTVDINTIDDISGPVILGSYDQVATVNSAGQQEITVPLFPELSGVMEA